MVKKAPIVLAVVIFFASCSQSVKMDSAQVDKIIIYGMARGIEFVHGIHSIDDVIRNGRDTVITDRATIKSLVHEFNHLRLSKKQKTHDFRTALVFISNNGESRYALLGENSGIQFDGEDMQDRASLFKFVENHIYGSQQNDYWLDEYSRSIIRLSSQAMSCAEQVFEYLKRSHEIDSLLLASLPTDYTDFSLMCSDLSVIFHRMGSDLEGGTGELILMHLLNSQFIDHELFVKKMTILSSTAYLPSFDAGSVLQQVIRVLVKSYPLEVISTLNQLTENKYKQFWDFYFYGFTKEERNHEEKVLQKDMKKYRQEVQKMS